MLGECDTTCCIAGLGKYPLVLFVNLLGVDRDARAVTDVERLASGDRAAARQ